MTAREQVEHNFTYHPPHGTQPGRYAGLREHGKQLALLILANVPESRERSLALTKLEEAVMWANAGIARNEGTGEPRPLPPPGPEVRVTGR